MRKGQNLAPIKSYLRIESCSENSRDWLAQFFIFLGPLHLGGGWGGAISEEERFVGGNKQVHETDFKTNNLVNSILGCCMPL